MALTIFPNGVTRKVKYDIILVLFHQKVIILSRDQ